MYIVDSNCFIQNSRAYNPMDIALSFWNKMTELANRLKFYSIDKVKVELIGGNDELSKWVRQIPADLFKPTTPTELKPYSEKIIPWAFNSDYKQTAKDRFLQSDYADPFLVAFALSHNDVTVVTEEVSAKDSKKDIKLPDVCNLFGIRSINFMDMLREMGETY